MHTLQTVSIFINILVTTILLLFGYLRLIRKTATHTTRAMHVQVRRMKTRLRKNRFDKF